MTATTTTVYTHGKLLLSIVDRNLGEKIVAVTKHAGARGGTIVLGRGTAESPLVEFLGIGDTEQDVVLTLATDERMGPILEALRAWCAPVRHRLGIALLIDVSHILKHVALESGSSPDYPPSPTRRSPMETETGHVLITFIMNRGYADDAMVAARRAGAKGGTILNARGTGREEDVKFFGISLVPEKEVLLIVVETALADAVLEAVKQVPCLSEPGCGIAFRVGVEDFFPLGGKRG